MDISSKDIEAFRLMLANPKRIAIISHTNPDGDAMGSSLALCSVLRKQGHTVTCIVPNAFASYLNWIPGAEEILVGKDDIQKAKQAITGANLIICADMSNLSRIDELSEAVDQNMTAQRVLIDHHLNPSDDFDLSFSFPEASSASLLAYLILTKTFGKDSIDKTIATQLYAGIMTDTGNFSYSFLTPELFNVVADLSATGIDIPAIYNNVYNSFSESRARLFGYVISKKMKFLNKGTVSYMSLTEEEMRRFWFKQGDSEGFVNYPLSIKKMKMSAMFSQQNGFIRVSLRSRGNVDVDTFARRYFNGGGHKNAAGGKSFVDMAQTIKHYIESVEQYHAEGLV